MTAVTKNLFESDSLIQLKDRESHNRHKSAALWLTGLSGSGKSTLAKHIEKELFSRGCQVYMLDGDNIRTGINSDLDFSAESRTENIRRTGEVVKLFCDAGLIVITAFISPFENDRQRIRKMLNPNQFHEIYINCSLNVCESRDPKGLYKKARAGKISDFTGITSPFEVPKSPELIINTEIQSQEQCVLQLLSYLESKQIIQTNRK